MREIKFRGKCIKTGDWLYGTGITDFLNVYPEHKGKEKCWLWSNYAWHEIHPETVGQFTGLKDKNSKEIFDGDIVQFYKEISVTFPIESKEKHKPIGWWGWLGNGFYFSGDGAGYGDHFEIIGNITDNQELAEGRKA